MKNCRKYCAGSSRWGQDIFIPQNNTLTSQCIVSARCYQIPHATIRFRKKNMSLKLQLRPGPFFDIPKTV